MQRRSGRVPRRHLGARVRLVWRKLQSFQDPRYQGAPLLLPDHWHGSGDAADVPAEAIMEAFRTWKSTMANQPGFDDALPFPHRSTASS